MNKILTLFLVLVLLLSFVGCNNTPITETTAPAVSYEDPTMPKKLTVSQVTSLPLATKDMSYADRRQLCVDFFRLQVSAQWLSNMDIPDYTSYVKGTPKGIDTNTLYGGIPYCGSYATGNLYRWLEYYDQETGVFDMTAAVAENGGYGENAVIDGIKVSTTGQELFTKYLFMEQLFNHCTSSAIWSWGRVINSARFGLTKDSTAYNGYIPVGCYSYGYEHEGKTYDMTTIQTFGEECESNPLAYDAKHVVEDLLTTGGENALFDCYAQLKPGDALVNGGHMLMVIANNLYKSSDGTVDYGGSSIVVAEQIDAWAIKGTEGQRNFRQQGRDFHGYTFERLQKDHYIPFTFAELLDPNDPQDKKHLDYYASYADKLTAVRDCYSTLIYDPSLCGNDVEEAQVFCTYEGQTITPAQLHQTVIGSNYPVSDVFVTVTDKDGKQLLRNVYRCRDFHELEIPMTVAKCSFEKDAAGNLLDLCDGIADLANGENTVTVTMQLSTGQLLEVYRGTLCS